MIQKKTGVVIASQVYPVASPFFVDFHPIVGLVTFILTARCTRLKDDLIRGLFKDLRDRD